MTALARTGGAGRLAWAVNEDRRTLSVMRRARLKVGYGRAGLGRRR
jgi:hypothetical protein